PELCLALVLLGVDRTLLRRFARPALGAGALLAFLMIWELRGGGRTAHNRRAVLPVWYLIALAVGGALEQRGSEPLGRPLVWLRVPPAARWVRRGVRGGGA